MTFEYQSNSGSSSRVIDINQAIARRNDVSKNVCLPESDARRKSRNETAEIFREHIIHAEAMLAAAELQAAEARDAAAKAQLHLSQSLTAAEELRSELDCAAASLAPIGKRLLRFVDLTKRLHQSNFRAGPFAVACLGLGFVAFQIPDSEIHLLGTTVMMLGGIPSTAWLVWKTNRTISSSIDEQKIS